MPKAERRSRAESEYDIETLYGHPDADYTTEIGLRLYEEALLVFGSEAFTARAWSSDAPGGLANYTTKFIKYLADKHAEEYCREPA
jgi:hypothetical protein